MWDNKKGEYFKTSDNYYLYYEDYGSKENNSPIVMLHGFLCCSKFFTKNIEALSKRHRLILIDWRGHGQSGKTTMNLTMRRCAQDLKELFDALDLRNITLLTHSMSSSINCEYYNIFGPYRLKKTVICDSNLYPFSIEEWNVHQLRGGNMDRISELCNFSRKEFFEYCDKFSTVLFKDTPSSEVVEAFAREMKKVPYWMAFPLYGDFAINNYVKTLPNITIPLLIIGAHSLAHNGIVCAKHYKEVAPQAELCLFENTGHMMFYEDPETFNKKVLEFVEQ